MFSLFRLSLAAAQCCVMSATFAQLPPDEALAHMKVADGFEVTLFASEPDLWNPTSMDIDAEGRVWVAEAVNYRLFNQPRTTELGDRIRVLEDTDGDGKCDKATTFYQDPTLQAPMGIAVLGKRVYVCQSPDLFYLEDTNGDGVADKRTVILTGFGGIDNDHAIHGVNWGPDGKLYMSNGDQGLDVTDKKGNRVHAGKGAPLLAATVLRTDLEGEHLEWLAQGMRNPYEPTIDSYGNVFISDNDDDGNENTRINYVMEGGNYGYWPRRQGDRHLESVHWNADRPGVVPRMIRTGFGSPCGLMVYEGRALPERVWGALIHAEAGPREIRAFRTKPDGAGFSAEMEVLLRCEDDSWFRPVDVSASPDGSLYIADWYDPGVGGHRMGDFARGRVYCLAATGHKATRVPLDLKSDEGLVEAFTSPNVARRYLAKTELDQRAAKGDTDIAKRLLADERPEIHARALWLTPSAGADDAVRAAAASENPAERVQAVRFAAITNHLASAPSNTDASPQVRRQLMLELARDNAKPETMATLVDLAAQYDGVDRFYREAIGIAFRGHEAEAWAALSAKLGTTWDARLGGLAVQLHPADVMDLATKSANDAKLSLDLRKLALQALDAIGSLDAGARITRHAMASSSHELQAYALELLARDGGTAWRAAVDASDLDQALRVQILAPATRQNALNFIKEAQRDGFVPELLAIAADTARPLEERVWSIQTASPIAKRRNTRPDVMEQLVASDQPTIAAEALMIVSRFRDEAAANILLVYLLDSRHALVPRRTALHGLAEMKSGQLALLRAAESDQIAPDLEFDTGEVLRSSKFDDVRMLAGQILPPETMRDGTPLPSVTELLKLTGDAERGHGIFFSEERSQCYRCHVVHGEGKAVGPNLSNIGTKYGPDGLLESILNPSAAISHEFIVWVVETKRDVFTGYIRKDTAEGVELMDSNGTIIPIPARDITDRYKSALSLMPNGLAAGMTAQELADVVAFLYAQK